MGQETTNDLMLIISQQSSGLQHPKVARLMTGNICEPVMFGQETAQAAASTCRDQQTSTSFTNVTFTLLFLTFLGTFTKLRKASIRFVMSVCQFVRPHGTTQLQLDGFS